jgi:hypothetical protein
VKLRLLAFMSVLCCLCLAPLAYAQTNPVQTPLNPASVWWAFVVVLVPAVVEFCKRLGPGLWAWVPQRVQWAPAALLTAAAAIVPLLETGESWQVVATSALEAFLASIGLFHTAKRAFK